MRDIEKLVKSDAPTPINSDAGSLPAPSQKKFYVKPLILQRGINQGERICVLMDRRSGAPVTLANEYMLCGKRLLLSPNTYFNTLSAIAFLYQWSEENNVSVAERLRGGVGFSDYEVNAIFAAVRKRRRQGLRGKLILAKSSQRARMICITDFVIDGMRAASFNLDPRADTERLNALEYRIETTRALFAQNTPSKEKSPTKKGLSLACVQRLTAVISPGSIENPWKSPHTRQRNFILVLLFLVTGGRRGDLAKVKVSDVVSGRHSYIRFDAHENDPDDTRTVEPRLKTQSREYPVHPKIADAITHYIEHHRQRIRNAANSEYLFLETTEGRELSLRSINSVFETLQRVIPSLTPHILRHTNTEGVLRSAKSLGLAQDEILQTIMYLNGWLTDNVSTYTAREREETARVVASVRQEEFFIK